MTLEETGQLMDILRVAYPGFYKNSGEEEIVQAVKTWHMFFSDEEPAIVIAAVKALIETDEKGFPPHIGAVKSRIRQLTEPPQMTELEAWALVSRAASNSIYGAQREYDRLPPLIQKVLGSSNTLREYALCEQEVFNTVVQSNFMRSYRVRASTEREFNALPTDVKKLISDKMFSKKLLED